MTCTLCLIDALGVLFRAFHAIPPMHSPDYTPTNALYGFVRSVLKIQDLLNTTHMVVVFDGPNSTYTRSQICPKYKETRTTVPDEFYQQINLAIQFCNIYGLSHLSIPNVEADDVIATLVQKHHTQVSATYIYSDDKDLAQLVKENVFTVTSKKQNQINTLSSIQEQWGVSPTQIAEFLALVGDHADNIAGVPSIGKKTAAALLQEFSTIEGIFNNLSILPPKKQAILQEYKEQIFLNKKLTTLQEDVLLDDCLEKYILSQPNIESLYSFYESMGFHSLCKTLQSKLQSAPLEPYLEPYTEVITLEQGQPAFIALQQKKPYSIYIHTQNKQDLGICISLQGEHCFYFPLPFTSSEVPKSLEGALQNNAPIVHDIKCVLKTLEGHNITVFTCQFDTLLAAYLLQPDQKDFSLETLSRQHLHTPPSKLEQSPASACLCANNIFHIHTHLYRELCSTNLMPLFQYLEMPLAFLLHFMEKKGIYLDVNAIKTMKSQLLERMDTIEQKIFFIAEESFNIKSTEQLRNILFIKLSLPVLEKTSKGTPSTKAQALEKLYDKSPIIPLILEYRQLEKLRSSYLETLPLMALPPHYTIHCTFAQTGTSTGRLSCHSPNMQNIPKYTRPETNIRALFKPRDSKHLFLSADYSQIELRILAHLSEEPVLLSAFHAQADIHTEVAAQIYNLAPHQVTPQMRHQAKTVNFGILYGQTSFGLAKELRIPLKEADDFIKKYHQKYPKVKEFLTSCKETAQQLGYTTTLLGRKRFIPHLNSPRPNLRSAAERLAVNAPIQGSAADLIKSAMLRISEEMDLTTVSPLLQIHDELLFELPEHLINQAGAQIKDIMENVWSLKVPLTVNISIGKNWDEC